MPNRSGSLLVLAVLSGVASTLTAQKLDRRLKLAAKLLESRSEVDVRNGTDSCVAANNVAAVDLLLGVLGETKRRGKVALHPAHFRDIVWDGLVRITDAYARQRVELELRKNRRNPFVRQWCAQLLGVYGDQSFGVALGKALSDKDAGVQRWAARSIGQMKFAAAQPQLLELIHHKNPYVRANATEALAAIDAGAHEATFLAALREDADGGVRCALLGAVPAIYAAAAEELSAKALEDADWRPRMQAVDNLAQIETRSSIDGLVRATRDGRPVVAARAERVLREMTGEPIRSAQVWELWWRDHRTKFEFPEKQDADSKGAEGKAEVEPAANTVAYNDIPMESDHAAFLIDRSIAMGRNLSSEGVPKAEAANRELDRVLGLLHGRLTFNVFGYHEDIEAFSKEPVELDDKNRKRALKFIAKMEAGRAKDIWQALETVLEDPMLDTAYLLSSGEPDIGTYVHWNRVTEHLQDLNRFHKVTVHAIAYSERQYYRDQLEKIAKATGGEFRAFE